MWVLLRLLTAAVVGIVNYFKRRTFEGTARQTGTIAWRCKQDRHKGRIIATTYGVEFTHPIFFRLSREGGLDRFFKSVGFAREIQTGDRTFDETVYVSCDHPAIAPVLQADAAARHAITTLFEQGAARIQTDGACLSVYCRGDRMPDEATLRRLVTVRDALAAVPVQHLAMLRDAFFWRALLVESIAWSVAVYGFPVVLEIVFRRHPQYFTWTPIIWTGLGFSVFVFGALFGLSWWLLRGSSRAHRVFTESIIVLGIGVPLSSIQAVSDVNIAFDASQPTIVESVVESKYTRTRRRRRGGRRTDHYVVLQPPLEARFATPRTMKVSDAIYQNARAGVPLQMVMRDGALGIPWVEDVRPAP